MADILVVGSINTDLVVRAPRFPEPGETLSGEDLQIIPGGKGANQAVAAARQGASVAMVGRVGNDSFGSDLIDNLQQNGVETTFVLKDPQAASGSAIIVVDANGQNSIVLSPGGNGRLTPADLAHVPFSAYRLLLLQLETPLETVLAAACRAKEHGLPVLLNPAPARPLPQELLSLCDYIVPNETELSRLTGEAVIDMPSTEKAAQSLLAFGIQNVVVTLGASGALLVNREKTEHMPPFRVEVVDTTAAGDAFLGGLASMLLEGRSLEEAVRYGCACGALATTRFGAQPSLPRRKEVERFLQDRPNSP